VQAITKTNVGRDLGLLLKHLLGSTNREFFAELQDAGISFSQLKCLGVLSNAEAPLSLGALSEDLGLSLPAVSRAVDGLVQRGAVKRQEDPSDRRSKLVNVSARGRAIYERVVRVRVAGVERFVESLEPDDRDALGAALGPIVEGLRL
jgi:DNA-binding MarR family transcriptional regulator